MISRFNIVTKRVFTQAGVEKSHWQNCGTLVHFPASKDKAEGFALELNMFPDTKFFVFPQESKQKEASPVAATEELSGDNIPF